MELLTISDKNITDENVEDRQTLPRSLALRPGVQKRISPYQTSGRPGLALPLQEYQSTRVLQYWIGTASTRVPECQSTAVLDWHWQYKSTRALEYCRTGLALPVQEYQSTRVLHLLDGHCQYKSTRAPEYCSTGLAWQYTSTHFLRHIYHARQSQFINISIY